MSTASVSQLKAQLSRYLREVRRGGEVQVLDRGIPVARLTAVPGAASTDSNRRDHLSRAGVLRLGGGDVASILSQEPVRASTSLRDAVVEDREDRA